MTKTDRIESLEAEVKRLRAVVSFLARCIATPQHMTVSEWGEIQQLGREHERFTPFA